MKDDEVISHDRPSYERDVGHAGAGVVGATRYSEWRRIAKANRGRDLLLNVPFPAKAA
jgi:hypothetical protein